MRRTQPQEPRDLRRAGRQRLCRRSGVGQQIPHPFDVKAGLHERLPHRLRGQLGIAVARARSLNSLVKVSTEVPRDDLQTGGETSAKTKRRNLEASLQQLAQC